MAEKASAPMWKNGNAGRNEKHQKKKPKTRIDKYK